MIETFLVFEQFLTKTLFPNFCGGVYMECMRMTRFPKRMYIILSPYWASARAGTV